MAAGAAGAEGAAGPEEAGGATGCPNTLLPAVVVVLSTVRVGVVTAAATVVITGIIPRELLSVIAGAG